MLRSKERYKSLGIGSTFLEVNKRDTERFEILVAPLPQQQRIAEILSTVDEAIEQTEALIAKTQAIKAGLMHDLFTRGVTKDGRLRPPREEAPQLYKQSPLGWIPREWGVIAIGDAFEIQLGKMLSKASKTGTCSAPYIGNRAVQWDRVDLSNLEEMDFTPSERRKYALAAGDLLVCEGGDVGRTAMWHGEVSECFYQKAIHRLRPSNGLALPEYMLRYMRYFYDVGGFHLFTSQSSIAHLTQEKLAVVPLRLPQIAEQVLLADRFMAIDQRVETEANKKEKLKTVKRGLMHDLLTGQVRVDVKQFEETRA
jgi:type I restriction enzyme S subunit